MKEITDGSEKYIIREAIHEDIPTILKLYEQVAITKDNYLEKLNEGELSFAKTGGMFVINNADSMAKIIDSKDERVYVGVCDNKVRGMIWYSLRGEYKDYQEMTFFEDKKDYESLIDKITKDGSASPGGEVMIEKNSKHGVLSMLLFHQMMQDLYDHGDDYLLGVAYRVDGYTDSEGSKEVSLLNEKSFYRLMHSGGTHIGVAKQKHLDMDGYSVDITPMVLVFDTKKCAELTYEQIIKRDLKYRNL